MKVEDKTKIKKRYGWIISIIVLLILAIIVCIPTDYYLESPGSVFPVSEFITTKQKKYENLNMVTVSVSRNPISIGQYLWSYTQKFDSRVSSKELLGNQSNSQYEELQNWYMETSQQNAVYYAAKKAKLKPKLSYFGVYVLAIQKNSSFKHKLQIGDTVLGANGKRFHSTQEMMDYLNKQKVGKKVTVNILRNKKEKSYTGKIVKLAKNKRKGIGISLVERVKVKTTPALKIDAGSIGGPSAGLMFALDSYQIFTHKNLSNNHKIAGTGTIDPTGKVGIIGGVDKKVVAADKAGAEVFFAPTDSTGVAKNKTNYVIAKKVAKQINSKMKIVPVANFDDALSYLSKKYK